MDERLPQVDKLLRHPVMEEEQKNWRRDIFVQICRDTLSGLRAKRTVETGGKGCNEQNLDSCSNSIDHIAALVLRKAKELRSAGLRKVINGTGVVLNTNLGRAPLSRVLIEQISEIVCGYSNLELDLETGKRGKRSERVKVLLRLLTGCESALVVNNNAAAVVLAVNCFAKNREVIVSRGELIEIGGSFRLPDVIESAGARLKEVGTTNRTRIADYEKSIGTDTGLLMRCHRSNFRITGFTEQVELAELVNLSQRSGVPFLEDLGSGVLVDLVEIGLHEPTVSDVVKSGCGLVSFSGDKLLGGPQAGIIVGKKVLVDQLARHPLYRALRVDKVTNALLEQSLLCYLEPNAFDVVPTLRLMSMTPQYIKQRTERFVTASNERLKALRCRVVESNSAIGGGSLPGEEKASWAIVIEGASWKASRISAALRELPIPVIGTVQNDEFRIDFRTVFEYEEDILLKSLETLDCTLVTTNCV